MIAMLVIHQPKPEHADDLIGEMKRFGPELSKLDGIQRVEAWREAGGERIFAMSVWRDEAAAQAAMPQMGALLEGIPFDEWEVKPYEALMVAPAF